MAVLRGGLWVLTAPSYPQSQARAGKVAGTLIYPIYLLHHNMGYLVLQSLGGHLAKNVLIAAMLMLLPVLAWLLPVMVERLLGRKLCEKGQQLISANLLGWRRSQLPGAWLVE